MEFNFSFNRDYTSKLYNIELHEHAYQYTVSERKGNTVTVTMKCTAPVPTGCECLYNSEEGSQAYMTLTIPDGTNYDDTAKTVTESRGSSFMQGGFGVGQPIGVTYYTLDGQKTTTDWFGGSGASSVGNAPKEDGKYYAMVHFPATTLIKTEKNVQLNFTIDCDVYKISPSAVKDDQGNQIGAVTYTYSGAAVSCGPAEARTNRPAAGTKVTATVKAEDWNGWVVDGLIVTDINGKEIATFDALQYGSTGTAVATYTFTMPAAHVVLTPLFRVHEHIWATEWSSTSAYHWHDCLAANCTTGAQNNTHNLDKRDEYHVHTFGAYEMVDENYHKRECEICHYVEITRHTFEGAWITSEAMHWQNCKDCIATQGATHNHGSTGLIIGHGDMEGKHYYQCQTCKAFYDITNHSFTLEISSAGFEKSAPTCTQDGIYYKSCECGEHCTDTFTVSALGHNTCQDIRHDGTNHYYECSICREHITPQAHNWVESCEAIYLVGPDPGDCTQNKTYYEVCSVCLATSSATFTSHSAHILSDWKSDSLGNHYKECSICGKKSEVASHAAACITYAATEANYQHFADKASCTHCSIFYKTCETCHAILTSTFAATEVDYNDTAAHIADTTKNYDKKYLKSEATCTQDAVYYESCVNCGATMSGTFSKEGSKIAHKVDAFYSLGPKGHLKVCSVCGAKDGDENSYWFHTFSEIYKGSANAEDGRTVITLTTTVAFKGQDNVSITLSTRVAFVGIGEKTVSLSTNVSITSGAPVTVTLTCSAVYQYHIATCSACKYCTGVEEHFTNPNGLYYKEHQATCQRPALCDICGEQHGSKNMNVHVLDPDEPYISTPGGHSPNYSCNHLTGSAVSHRWVSEKITKDNNIYYDLWMDLARVCTPGNCSGVHTIRYDYCIDCNYGRKSDENTKTFTDERVNTAHDFSGTGPAAYLIDGPTCEMPAKYYCVCKYCGVSGYEFLDKDYSVGVFYSGSALGHKYEYTRDSNESHSYTCTECHKTDTEQHDYSIKEATTEYLVSEKTCVTGAAYYMHCVCGATKAGVEFISGPAAETHDWEMQYDGAQHWQECKWCHATQGAASHTLTNGATCKENEHCTICDYKTSNIGPHVYNTEYTKDEDEHYIKCQYCDEKTSKGAHILNGHYVTDAGTHYYVTTCSICGWSTNTTSESHRGGTPTCTQQAICEVCNMPYGETASHTYTSGVYQHNDDHHWQVCNKCGYELNTSHTWVNCTDASCRLEGPTCTLGALYSKKCSDCGATSSSVTFRDNSADNDKPIKHNYQFNHYVSSSEAIYKCQNSNCSSEVNVKLQIDGADVSGTKNYVYKPEGYKPVTVVYGTGWKDTYSNLTDITLTYPENTASVGAITVSATSTDGLNLTVTYNIVKAQQSGFSITNAQYTYEDPQLPEFKVGNLKENPSTVFYYRLNDSSDWIAWNTVLTTTALTPGSYQIYATIGATHDYHATETAVQPLTVYKANQNLVVYDISIPYETVGMRVVVNGDRTPLTYKVTGAQDVITINETTGVITTLRGGNTKITVSATETAFFNPASTTINVEVTARALDVKGVKMSKQTDDDVVVYYYGEDIEYSGVPYAALKKIERAIPGWEYKYTLSGSATKLDKAPTEVGEYNLYVTVLDDNHQYDGVQIIPFVIKKATPTLSDITANPITYMDLLTSSAVHGTAMNPYKAISTDFPEVDGKWEFVETTTPAVADSNKTTYKIIFTPTGDFANSYTTAEAFITLTVNKRAVDVAIPITCSSYTYGGSVPTITIGTYTGAGWAYGDGSQPTATKYYYSPTRPTSGTDGNVWNPSGSTSVEPGTYFMWAEIGSDNYQTTYTAITEFTVYKGTQAAPSFTVDDDTVTVAKENRKDILEYSVDDGTTWMSVPKLDKNGKFVIAGLTQGAHRIYLRKAETNFYYASPATNAATTVNRISVAYHANRGVGSIPPVFVKGTTVVVSDGTGISRIGYTFDGWATTPEGSEPTYGYDDEITQSAILYAQWVPINYNVAFDANGGSGDMEGQNFTYGVPQAITACGFTLDGKQFAGWATTPNGSVIYADKEVVSTLSKEDETVTLYAIWAEPNSVTANIYSFTNSSINVTLIMGSDIITSQSDITCDVSDNASKGAYKATYTFTDIPAGLYNIIVEQAIDTTTEPAVVKIMTEQIYVDAAVSKDIIITDSRVKSLLEVKPGTRHVVVDGLAKEAEGKRAENKDVVVKMDVEAVVKEELPPTATDLERQIQRDIVGIDAIAKTPIVEYFNADIFETITRMGVTTSSTTSQIRNTHTVMEIVVPYDITGVRSIQIYRAHNGQAVQLSRYSEKPDKPVDGRYWVDWTNGLIHLYATKFSVYAIGINAPEPQYWGGGGGGAVKVTTPGYVDCPKDETCPIEPYIDAINTAWYHDGVHFCIEEKIMLGRGAITFVPEGTLLRAEIVTMLWRMAGSKVVSYDLKYKDIEMNRYYTDALRWATKMGVVTGYDETHFGPQDNVTREQLSTMLFRYAQIIENEEQGNNWATELTFKDTAKISDFAVNGVHWCFENKIVEGKPNNIFDPKGNATRAEAACMVQRFCNR